MYFSERWEFLNNCCPGWKERKHEKQAKEMESIGGCVRPKFVEQSFTLQTCFNQITSKL